MTLDQTMEVHKHDQAFLGAFVNTKRLKEQLETITKVNGKAGEPEGSGGQFGPFSLPSSQSHLYLFRMSFTVDSHSA